MISSCNVDVRGGTRCLSVVAQLFHQYKHGGKVVRVGSDIADLARGHERVDEGRAERKRAGRK